MSVKTSWCDVCRGDAEGSDDLIKCKTCPRRYHLECAKLQTRPEAQTWTCTACEAGSAESSSDLKARITAVHAAHEAIKARRVAFYKREAAQLKPFVEPARLRSLTTGRAAKFDAISIGPQEPFISATLRPYQIDGVNWILKQYALGTGGILGDEMGLGKVMHAHACVHARMHP